MNSPVLILGTGKMARNIGSCFLAHGHAVTWYSEHAGHLAECEEYIAKVVRRLKRNGDEVPEVAFVGAGGMESDAPYLLIEATHESIDKKRKVLAAFRNLLGVPGTVLLSTSSSLLPDDIHPDCIGCHFFHPVELTGMVELILPDSVGEAAGATIKTVLSGLRLSIIEQTVRNAFAINRLLLPLQNEVFRLLIAGYEPREIDDASASPYCPLGQCSFMDMVGIDTIYASVVNYLSRMPASEQAGYAHLRDGLRQMVAANKYGRKNGNGICIGEPLAWQRNGRSFSRHDWDILQNMLRLTCDLFVADGQFTEDALSLALTSVFNADATVRRQGGP